MSYILHQASVQHLPPHRRTVVVTELSLARRRHTGVETAQLITDMYRTTSNDQWRATLANLGR